MPLFKLHICEDWLLIHSLQLRYPSALLRGISESDSFEWSLDHYTPCDYHKTPNSMCAALGESGDGCNMAYLFNQEWATVIIFILHMLNHPPPPSLLDEIRHMWPFLLQKKKIHGKKVFFFNHQIFFIILSKLFVWSIVNTYDLYLCFLSF